MTTQVKLTLIAVIAGTILAVFLKIIQILTGSEAYQLLFNMEYIPLLRNLESIAGMGYLFHFCFCIASVIGLYYVLKFFHSEKKMAAYIIMYTLGSGILYFLTGLTDEPPEVTSISSWTYWTTGHAIYGIVVGILVRNWID